MTDQPEPLPTVLESAPRECMDIGPVRFFRCELPIGHEGLHMGGPHEWRRDATGHMDYAGARVKESTWSAPRPVPETARPHTHTWADPAIETAVAICMICGEGTPAPPAEPVEEAQRCATCKHKKTAHVENEDEWGYCNDCGPEFAGVHEFEVEDEGARPQRTDFDSHQWLWVDKAGVSHSWHVPSEVEAAIRKEAIAAQAETLATKTFLLDEYRSRFDNAAAQWLTERTRAEAAELEVTKLKELDVLRYEALQAAEGAMRDVQAKFDAYVDQDWEDHGMPREPRALTAEAVTPTGGSDGD